MIKWWINETSINNENWYTLEKNVQVFIHAQHSHYSYVCIETKYIHCEAHIVYKYLQQKRERWIYYEYNCEPNIVIDLDLNNRVACV